jgi:hypothetical protein
MSPIKYLKSVSACINQGFYFLTSLYLFRLKKNNLTYDVAQVKKN